MKKVEEIGRSVLLKYDGSPIQALVAGVKRSDEIKDKFIISYAFQNPGSDGRHLLEAMFDKDDEKNKPVSFSIGRYASHSLTVDTMSPNLSLFEEKRACFDIYGWLVSGKVSDPGTNPSGIGILATWTDLAGYIGFPATGILDQFKNIPLHYDISVKDFQLGKYDESAFNEYNNVYTTNFIYNPVNGWFQIDDKPIEHAGRLTLVATDKAGNQSSPKTITWGPESEITVDNQKADHFFWKTTDDKICLIKEVDPDILPELTHPKGPNGDYLQITANNHHPEIESIEFKNALNSRILESIKDNELIIKWKDPDDSAFGSSPFGLDPEKCMVSTGLDGPIHEEEEYRLDGFKHKYTGYDDSLLSNGFFRVKVAVVDKLGSWIEKEEIFFLNIHKPDIAFDSFDASSDMLTGNISGDQLDIMKINITARLLNDKGTVITQNTAESNPANLTCKSDKTVSGGGGEITFPGGSSRTGSTTGNSTRTIEKYGKMLTPNDASTAEDIRLQFDSQTGDFSYIIDGNLFPKQVELIISAMDSVCNKITKGVRFEVPGRPFTVKKTTHETGWSSGAGGNIIADLLNLDEMGDIEYYKYDPYRTQLFLLEESDDNQTIKQNFISNEYFTFMPDANRALLAALAWWHYNYTSWNTVCAFWANLSDFIRMLAKEPDFMKEFQKQAVAKYNDHAYYRLPYALQEKLTKFMLKMYDYCGKESSTKFEVDINYPPDIENLRFNEDSVYTNEVPVLTATITDRGKNLSFEGFTLMLNGKPVPSGDFAWSSDTGEFIFKPVRVLDQGAYTAVLLAVDEKGNKTEREINFIFAKKNYPLIALGKSDYDDIEGNLDGIINEGERIYLNVELTNQGEGPALAVQADLLNRSRYIKGIPESKSPYDDIKASESKFNSKGYEFVVIDSVFNQRDIDQVLADFVLRVTYAIKISNDPSVVYKTIDLPFNLQIFRLDPALAQFNIKLLDGDKETLNSEYYIKGQWYSKGCFLETIKMDQYSGNQISDQSTGIEIDKTSHTFSAKVNLLPGDNRFVVTAMADNGVVRTAEVSVKLLSHIGVKLDAIADTKDPNVIVTGNAWTVNSKLEKVEIYLNGGLIGDAILDDGCFSLPVTLNGGENMIRAIARDDQGKSAMDEIKINMHGPLTLRWQRAHWRTTESPVAACGSYEVEGDDIASIVTYVNNTPNTYEVVIDRNLKTFCTTAGLQPGSNLLRAVGTTTSGVTAEAYSRVDYNTGGVLSVTIDPPANPAFETTATISGSFTLANSDPYTIQIDVLDCEMNSVLYTPTINPLTQTFIATINLHDPIPNDFTPGDNRCDPPMPCDHIVTATITQGADSANNAAWMTRTEEMEVYGVDSTSGFTCGVDTSGWIEGSFLLNAPGAHVASIRYWMLTRNGEIIFDVLNYDEVSGIWHLDFDIAPDNPWGDFEVEITDTFGNIGTCSGIIGWCQSNKGDPIPFDPNKAKNSSKVRPNEQRRRLPKRTVDGN